VARLAESTLDQVGSYQVVVIDTPPGIEGSYASILRLCELADFVLVPTGSTIDDLDAVIPWMRTLSQMGAKTAFCLNRVNSRTSSYKQARTKLLKIGPLCPVEVPQLEDMHVSANAGLTPLDVPNSKGIDAIEGLWEFVRREARL
jgi:chromosome partitioning protein